jgi:glutathione S-transferase
VAENGQPTEIFLKFERRARRDFAARVKQISSIISTLSYGALASALWKPLLEGARFTMLDMAVVGIAIFALTASVYLAPQGEFDAKQ